MPNRILKESICRSASIDALSVGAEVLFYRLVVQADDYGCFDGRPSVVRSICYPLRTESVSIHDVTAWLAELEHTGILRHYSVDAQPLIQFISWDKHQRVRAQRSKYPQPVDGQLSLVADIRGQARSSAARALDSDSDSDKGGSGGDSSFDGFWLVFPRHVGKRAARAAFERALGRASAKAIIAGAQRLRGDPNLPEPEFIPHPTTWLNRDGWEDELLPSRNGQAPVVPKHVVPADPELAAMVEEGNLRG